MVSNAAIYIVNIIILISCCLLGLILHCSWFSFNIIPSCEFQVLSIHYNGFGCIFSFICYFLVSLFLVTTMPGVKSYLLCVWVLDSVSFQSRDVSLFQFTVAIIITCVEFDIIFTVQLVQIIILCIDILPRFFYKAWFPEVPCSLPLNNSSSLLLLIFLYLVYFCLSNWGNVRPLWWPWLNFYCYTLTPNASGSSE